MGEEMTYLKEKPESVCKLCEWLHAPPRDADEYTPDTWECRAPELATHKGWCPMTGREQTNYPLCRVINNDGKCKHYEPRK